MPIFEAVFGQVLKLEDVIGYKPILKPAIGSVQMLGPVHICFPALEGFIGYMPATGTLLSEV